MRDVVAASPSHYWRAAGGIADTGATLTGLSLWLYLTTPLLRKGRSSIESSAANSHGEPAQPVDTGPAAVGA